MVFTVGYEIQSPTPSTINTKQTTTKYDLQYRSFKLLKTIQTE